MSYIRPNRGFGDYEHSTYSSEWPYNKNASTGMGCAGGCGCGGTCGDDHGMGLFDSADPTTWGIGEWGTLGLGGYVAISLFHDTTTVGRAVKKRASRKVSVGGIGVVGLLALAGGAYYLYSKSQAGAGLGAYMPQKYVAPQILVAPSCSAQVRIPAGW